MTMLIFAVLVGIGVTYFAVQNTVLTQLHVAQYVLPHIPLYIIVIGALLVGLGIGWVMSLLQSISSAVALRGRERTIRSSEHAIQQLQQKIHVLEEENKKLRSDVHESDYQREPVVTEPEEGNRPSFFQTLRHRFT